MGAAKDTQRQRLGEVIAYLVDEDFPTHYLDALRDIVCVFNESRAAEEEIIQFSAMIRKKYEFGREGS